MCTGVLPVRAAPCTSGRFLAVKTGAQTFHSVSFIYPRHVMHVQAVSLPGTATTLAMCSPSTACDRHHRHPASLTPVDVWFSVVRYS